MPLAMRSRVIPQAGTTNKHSMFQTNLAALHFAINHRYHWCARRTTPTTSPRESE